MSSKKTKKKKQSKIKKLFEHLFYDFVKLTGFLPTLIMMRPKIVYLNKDNKPNIKGGFMHIPFAPEQAITKSPSTATMPIPMIADGIKAAAKFILTNSEELKVNEGTEH